MKKRKIKGMFWHCHHDILCEYVYDYQERVDYIKKYKPKHEVETRLKLFKKVKGKLPKEYVKAGEKCAEAREKYIEAREKLMKAGERWIKEWEKYDEAWEKRETAREKFAPEIEKLHKKECGCKYWKNGELNFNIK